MAYVILYSDDLGRTFTQHGDGWSGDELEAQIKALKLGFSKRRIWTIRTEGLTEH